MADLDEFTDEELTALGECYGSGNVTEEMMRNNRPSRVMPTFRHQYRRLSYLWAEYKTYGQDVTSCTVDAGEIHEPEEDVWGVIARKETYVRKWYRVKNDGGATNLRSTLTWEKTYSSLPGGLRALLDEGGVSLPPVTCEPVMEGEMPEHWEEGYEEEGYTFYSFDEPSTFEDLEVITGSALASAAGSMEVLLGHSAWSPRKVYGRRWAEGNTLAFADFVTWRSAGSRAAGGMPICSGRAALPCTLKWKEVRRLNGVIQSSEDKHLDVPAGGGTVSVSFPYPP